MPEGLPYTWKTKMLGTICQLSGGYGFPDSFQGSVEGELPFIKVSDMSLPGNERDIVNANNYVSTRIANSMRWKPFPAGAVVFAKVGAALKLNRRRILIKPTLIDNNMMAAIPQGGFDSAFLYHFLCVIDFGDFVQDGALPSVNQEQVGSIKLPDINKDEQGRISEILDTIDEAIQKTEALISKLKAMKQGLLHDLLTRGLDKNGKLRDPKAHPEQFKDSPLGRIPSGWEIHGLDTVCQLSGGYGFPDSFQGSVEDELPFIKVSDMSLPGNERDIVNANNYVSMRVANSMGWKPFPAGAVVFAKVGAALKLNRRRILIKPTLIDNNMMAAIPQGGFDSAFLYHFLCVIDFGDFVQDGALPSVNQEQIASIKIPNINEDEQRRIADTLDTHDARIRTEEQYSDKLKLQKKGLMHDLLTGKVRVQI